MTHFIIFILFYYDFFSIGAFKNVLGVFLVTHCTTTFSAVINKCPLVYFCSNERNVGTVNSAWEQLKQTILDMCGIKVLNERTAN